MCVYCREPDSWSSNLNFGVDHYRPKSIPRFAHLICSYDNLFYCCANCNSRKGNDWPADEKAGPYVVNPCDHTMTDHIRFDAATAMMIARSPWGEHTRDLLQLNSAEIVAYRKSNLLVEKTIERNLDFYRRNIQELRTRLVKGKISAADHATEVAHINDEMAQLQVTLDRLTGAATLPPIPKTKLGLTL